ncbi:glycosyltransferase family 2 protein [Pseudaeromonas paramecii]|uniref:Glycosyltransferase family 2 protein n=1 Tax=Pseudaeromonas paramecii TaxID=2138166 RepID=A0ABP8PXJ6_9GAMM
MHPTAQATAPTVSIVIPAKNEVDNLRPLIEEIRAAMTERYDYELIYVDDGSTDDTFTTLQAIHAEGQVPLKVIRHAQSVGQSLAILSGAWQASGQWLVVLDADGQNDPADIPGMLAAVMQAHDQDAKVWGVIGHRVNRRDDWVKRLSSKLANGFRDFMLKDGIPDTGCGLKAVLLARYLRLPAFNHMHRYIPTLLQAQGGIMLVHPVNHRPRLAGKSNYGVWNRLWVGLVDVLGVWWLKRRAKVILVQEQL